MKIVTEIDKKILNTWKKQKFDENCRYKVIKYIKQLEVDKENILLNNVMTNEIILITKEEYENLINNTLKETNIILYRFLVTHWYLVPHNLDEQMMVYLYRNMKDNKNLVDNKINRFLVLTTTDCNARCYYCFEHGAKRINMTKQTAEDVAKFIISKADPKIPVNIGWFGGEPLYNYEVMDIISKNIRDAGLKLRSNIVSNGYLFDDTLVDKAVNLWNLSSAQITLDGTEEIYNKTKAYIYKDMPESPFETVLNNIERLSKANIRVSIRLNMSDKNYKDLYRLIDIIDNRFKKYNRISVDIAVLYENIENNFLVRTKDERQFIYNEAIKLEKYCLEKKLLMIRSITNFEPVKCHHCMADTPSSALISPEGKLGSCEHYVDSNFYGSIYDTRTFDRDYEDLRAWKETKHFDRCNSCYYYPKCYRIKRCAAEGNFDEICSQILRKYERSVMRVYREYKNKIKNGVN